MIAWLTRVESGSMAPTLRDGQLVVTRALGPNRPVRRGDVVVLDSVELGRHVIKRVVGLPGERVDIEAGRLRIDGCAWDEPYASPSVFNGIFEVPGDHYFLLGDNRDVSVDSRSWDQPFIARTALRGRLCRPSGRPSPRACRRHPTGH